MSESERLHILQMVQDGGITVDEAQTLLEALAPPAAPDTATTDTTAVTSDSPAPRKKKKRDDTPDMRRFRRYWEYPFIIGLILLGVAGLCASNTPYPLMMICGWSVFAVAGLVALVGLFSQWSPWMHIRVREQDGTRIAFSLPLPLQLADILLAISHALVRLTGNRKAIEQVETAGMLISALGDEPLDEPIMIEVDEPDGDHVEIFFG